MTTRIVTDPQQQDMLVKFISKHPLPFTIEITPGKHRTNRQNRLQRQWMLDLAAQRPEHSVEEWRGICKLEYGVPILRAENEGFAKIYDEVIRPLPYEAKVKIMMVPIDLPVTSKMNTKQKKQYLDHIQKMASEMGVILTDPESLKYQ